MDWEQRFKELKAIWKHDRNPKRPYARLTGGEISELYFNGSKVVQRPKMLSEVSAALVELASAQARRLRVDAVVGPSLGGITLAYKIAEMLDAEYAWFTEGPKGAQTLGRFDENVDDVLIVEDVVTTGGSTMGTIEAVHRVLPMAQVYPFILCLANRSGSATLPDGKKIIALVERYGKKWKRGSNPFTPDGNELVEPVSGKLQWNELNQNYP